FGSHETRKSRLLVRTGRSCPARAGKICLAVRFQEDFRGFRVASLRGTAERACLEPAEGRLSPHGLFLHELSVSRSGAGYKKALVRLGIYFFCRHFGGYILHELTAAFGSFTLHCADAAGGHV